LSIFVWANHYYGVMYLCCLLALSFLSPVRGAVNAALTALCVAKDGPAFPKLPACKPMYHARAVHVTTTLLRLPLLDAPAIKNPEVSVVPAQFAPKPIVNDSMLKQVADPLCDIEIVVNSKDATGEPQRMQV
jgi:hypothetical protein